MRARNMGKAVPGSCRMNIWMDSVSLIFSVCKEGGKREEVVEVVCVCV